MGTAFFCCWLICVQQIAIEQTPAAPAMPAPFTAATFREHVAYLASDELQGRDVGSPGSAKAMEYVVRHLKAAGMTGLVKEGGWYQDFKYGKDNSTTARNVLGVFHGKGALAKQALIVCSHHDHIGIDVSLAKSGKDGIFNGADDNASGCAAMLLSAQALDLGRERLPASYRTVIFASFDAEERGLLGSRFYVRNPGWPLENTSANITFDMIGRLFRGKVMAGDSESSAFLVERIQFLAPQCGLKVETRLSGGARADNASFLDRAVPAVHFNTGLHSDYHQVTDEVDKIDAEGGARVAWLGYRLLREMMENPNRIVFRRPPPNFDLQVILRLVTRLGLVPELNTQAGRYPLIQFVVPLSIAARQGFRAKDEIISINGQQFETLLDAAIKFGQLRLDRDVRLTVKREGKLVDLKIPAESLKEFAGPTFRSLEKDKFKVSFRFNPGKKADTVHLAGSFNNWDMKALPMTGPDNSGFYTIEKTLTRGAYEYKFVVNGKEWFVDPTNLHTSGPTGNSLLMLGE
jgi:hypothetical protein